MVEGSGGQLLAAKRIPTMTATTGAHDDVGKHSDISHKLNKGGA